MAKTKRTKAGKGFAQVQNNNTGMTLSAASQQKIAEMARQLRMTPSELVEELVNGKIAVVTEKSEKTVSIHPPQNQNQSSTAEIVFGNSTSPVDHNQIRTLEEQVSQLKKELEQQETLKQNYQAISLKSEQQGIYINELEEARSRQRQEIQNLNHRLNQLQSQVEIQSTQLHSELAAKDQQIAELQGKLQTLQSFASIGEKQVNRWRSRSIH
jgi:predicted RNase H-like nuclease (RuvC/YqgF family)